MLDLHIDLPNDFGLLPKPKNLKTTTVPYP